MGRPRGFDETAVVRSAAALFSGRAYDGTSIDDLVAHLGVHRNSLYKTFGSKRGLYLAALRWSIEHGLAPFIERIGQAGSMHEAVGEALAGPDTGNSLDLLLMAAVERAPADTEVAELVAGTFTALDQAISTATRTSDATRTPGMATALTAALLGLRVRTRSGTSDDDAQQAGAALAQDFHSHH